MLSLNLLHSLKINLINAEFCKLDSSWNYTNVESPFYRVYLITAGKGFVYQNSKKYTLTPGRMHLVPAFTLSSYRCPEYMEQYYLHFHLETQGHIEIFDEHNCCFQADSDEFEKMLFDRIIEINPDKPLKNYDPEKYDRKMHLARAQLLEDASIPSRFLETKGIILQLLSRFMVSSGQHLPAENQQNFLRLKNVISYIDKNLGRKITVSELADKCHLHPDYFSRMFLKVMGVRPKEYIHRKRIQRSQLLLITSDMSLERIAVQAGLTNSAYLARIFKKYTDQTPAEYRKKHIPLY